MELDPLETEFIVRVLRDLIHELDSTHGFRMADAVQGEVLTDANSWRNWVDDHSQAAGAALILLGDPGGVRPLRLVMDDLEAYARRSNNDALLNQIANWRAAKRTAMQVHDSERATAREMRASRNEPGLHGSRAARDPKVDELIRNLRSTPPKPPTE
jgi:hypothetical protein